MVVEGNGPFCRFKRAPNGTPLVCESGCLVPSLYTTLEEYSCALGTEYDPKLAEGHARVRCVCLQNSLKPKQFPKK
jgi:hypothetical protein